MEYGPLNPNQLRQLKINRSIPCHHSSEDGKKWTSCRIGIRIGTRCIRVLEGEDAEICVVDTEKDSA
jgi:hypothetical protein